MKKINKLLYRLVAILFICVLTSTSLLCGLLAKYTTNGTGEDSARVIKFHEISVVETGDFVTESGKQNAVILPGVNLKKNVTVSFGGSEAATIVFLELDLVGGWQKNGNEFIIESTEANATDRIECLSFEVNVAEQTVKDEGGKEKWIYLTNEGNKYVYYLVLEPNESIKNMNVIVNGDILVNEKITRARLAKLNSVKINVQATAVQANGFETVEDAWNSVKNK